MFKRMREVKILAEVRANMEREDLLKGLTLNSIKNKACNLMLNNKISDDFYLTIFTNEKIDMCHSYWELNHEVILNYKF